MHKEMKVVAFSVDGEIWTDEYDILVSKSGGDRDFGVQNTFGGHFVTPGKRNATTLMCRYRHKEAKSFCDFLWEQHHEGTGEIHTRFQDEHYPSGKGVLVNVLPISNMVVDFEIVI